MEIIAKTFAGLEDVLEAEIRDIGGTNIEKLRRSISFEGDLKTLYRANYVLRTALKTLVPIFNFEFKDVDEFYQKIYDFEWEKELKLNKTFQIEPVVNSHFFKNTHFAALKMKDAIVDRFMDKKNRRPNVDTYKSDVKINLYVNDNYCNVSLDSSGEPLFKRGYRKQQGKAPLNEVLAAGIIQLSEWDKKTEFLDFMCGSGTLAIEAAMYGLNIPAQFKRRKFGFQNWSNYDADLWQKVVEEENDKQSTRQINVFASDISSRALDEAAENVINAGLSAFISLKRQSFDKVKFGKPKHIVFNPPYGKRIDTKEFSIGDLYKQIGDHLKQNFENSQAWMFTGNLRALKQFGLKPAKKIVLYNGPIESRLVKYELYSGSKKIDNES